MRFRPTPRAATWFLREYCPNPKDESVIGDLTEQYQRSRGRAWYWQQVLAIVLVGLWREVRRHKASVLGGLVKAWLVHGVLNACTVIPLWVHYTMTYRSKPGLTASAFPLLTIRIGTEIHWPLTLLTVFVSMVILGMIGMDLASSSRVRPRTLVLAYLTLFVAATMASIMAHTMELLQSGQNAAGFLFLDLFALPVAPAVLLWGASLRKKKREAGSIAS